MDISLFRAFPKIKRSIPAIDLLQASTPVSLLHIPGEHRARVWLKNDARTAVPYGGNKPRKLQFILADARRSGAKELLTSGGIGSNHCLATLIFGKRLGFDVHLVLFPQPVTEHVRMSLRLFHKFGARMYSGSCYEQLPEYIAAIRKKYPGIYEIPPGGSSALGVIGFINAAFELVMQVKAGDLPLPRRIFIAAGTCGSLAGLVAGLKLAGLKIRLTGVRVVDRVVANPETVKQLAEDALAMIRKAEPSIPEIGISMEDFEIVDAYYGQGYGEAVPEGIAAASLMKRHYGIDLEQTYTAKTFAAVLDHVRSLKESGPVLYWHTFAGRVFSGDAEHIPVSVLPESFRCYFS